MQEQCKDITGDEQLTIAKQVAVAAIRFAILRVAPNKNVTFDMEAALAFAGDTGPYVQYCCARISSILRKHAAAGGAAIDGPTGERLGLTTDAEWALLLKINEFPAVVQSALAQRGVAPVGNYLLDLAHAFTTFYHDCPVLTAETDDLKLARLRLCAATRQTLVNGLHLLGIDAPERM